MINATLQRMRRGACTATAVAGAVWACLGGAASAQVPAWSLEAQARLLAGPQAKVSQVLAERQRLAQAGESALARGDTAAAQRAFEEAGLMLHSADIEAGLVRADMQAGDYRQALSFGAHTAGAHREVPAATALYAWLLHVGGQGVVAMHLLDEALALAPQDAALLTAREQLTSRWPVPTGPLLQPPLRAAPQAFGSVVPDGANAAGTAVLLRSGRQALVPAALLAGARALWLRNGLGQTVSATLSPTVAPQGSALLDLTAPLPTADGAASAERSPFAGSPGYMVEYVASSSSGPTWPLLRQGFFGRVSAGSAGSAESAGRPLGIDAPAGPRGGPVFDAQGRVAGIAMAGVDGGSDLLVAFDVLPPITNATTAATLQPAQRTGLDAIYASALRIALQVLVQR